MEKPVKYSKISTSYNLSKKVVDAVEQLLIKEYPSLSFTVLVEHLASKQIEKISDNEFDDIAKVTKNLTFTRKFRSKIEQIAIKQSVTSRLTASAIVNRLLEKSLLEGNSND
ncbi:MAG: hypothetical protein KGZ71_09875 [Desulfobulbaceae bacterium]|nr:hypothetical protein [Desulfobulbaceae bacterium]